jgi:hypothetical protein
MEPESVQFCTSLVPESVPECDPTWKTETVLALARGIHQEQAYDRLPILADALEEAGCQYLEVLEHCRREVDHHRSCWVIDWLILQDRIAANYQRMLALESNVVRYETDFQHQAEVAERKKRFLLFIVLGIVGVGLPGLILTLLKYEKEQTPPPRLQPVMPITWRVITIPNPDSSELQPLRRSEPAFPKYRPLIQQLEKTGLNKQEKNAVPPELPRDVTPQPK